MSMTKARDGYRILFVQIHEEVWDALDRLASAEGSSLARVTDRILAAYCRIDTAELTPPKRAGRKRKSAKGPQARRP